MPIIRSGVRDLWTQKQGTTTPLFVPMTGPINTNLVKTARISRNLVTATSQLTVQRAYQMSDDGITWSGTVTAIGSFSSTLGWVYDTGALTNITTDQRLFVRFGLLCADGSGTQVEQGQGELYVEISPIDGDTLATVEKKVWSDGTVTAIFHPLTRAVSIAEMGDHRASIQLQASSGNLTVQPGFQLSNDGVTWTDGLTGHANGTFQTLGSSRNSEGITYATTFSTPTLDEARQFVRYGVAANDSSASTKTNTGMVSLRVDYRRTT